MRYLAAACLLSACNVPLRSFPSTDASIDADPSTKELLSFGFLAADNSSFLTADVPASITGDDTVRGEIRFADIRALKATFTSTAQSVTVDGVEQASGQDVHDFTQPVTYSLHALDGTTRDYTVIVTAPGVGPRTELPAGNVSSNGPAIAVGDLNGDGLLDVAVARTDGNISVLINDTTPADAMGVFASKLDLPTTSGTAGSTAVAIADVNGDTMLDLVATNQNANTVAVLLNKTTTSSPLQFANKVEFGTTTAPRSIAVADLNADNKPDIAVSGNGGGPNLSVLMNTTTSVSTPTFVKTDFAQNPSSFIAIADLDRQGAADLAYATVSSNVSYRRNTTGAGSSTASLATEVGVGDSSGAVFAASGDVNRDGKTDLIYRHNPTELAIAINMAPANPLFDSANQTIVTTGQSARSLAFGDLNGDTNPDLVTCENGGPVLLLLNKTAQGALTTAFMPGLPFATVSGDPHPSVAVGDFNNDQLPDIAVANATTVSIWLAR